MHKIKFSHNYPKLYGQRTAQLLKIERLKIPDDLNETLRVYDTQYRDDNYYPLRNGDYLLLVLLGNLKIPFTAIRRYTPDKEDYYMSMLGDTFLIEIAESEDMK
jgi:hypothetical protein